MLANHRHPGNLPKRPTRFVGHADEVMRLAAALDSNPIVTLTGPGGVGKTRTGIELARRVAEYFPDGVWFVNLALLDDGADVVPFVCETLRDVAPVAHEVDSFAAALRDRRVLLLFDSCEHVLAQTAELVAAIAAAAPNARIVATSRQPFGMEREVEHRVESLSLEDGVELYYDRARSAGVTVADDLRDPIAALVQRLDAIPLAIELAAPQLRTMPPDELLRHLDDRMQLLAMENRGAPSRQQTLEAMHDWSHRLLSENAQKLFRRMAIFVGGCTLEAAMYVCADGDFNEARLSEALDELIAKSLVISDEPDADGLRRYRMLEITRAYAQSRIFETNEYDEAAQAHVHYYVALARRLDSVLEAVPVRKWQSMVMVEAQNFRAALSLALDAGDVESPAAICESLHVWLWSYGAVHAADLTRRIATILATTMEPAVEAPLRLAHASLLRNSDRHRALESGKRSYELYRALGDVRHFTDALRSFSSLQHDVTGAPTPKLAVEIEHYANVMLEMGSTLRAAELLNALGVSYAEMLDDVRLNDASVCFERAAGLLEARGDRERAGRVIGNVAVTAYLLGDRERAVRWSRRAVTFFDQVPDSMEAGHQWNNLGYHLTRAGHLDEAREALHRGIEIASERNDRTGLAEVLESTAEYYHTTGENRLAARILGCADAMQPSDLARQAREVGVLQELLDGLRAQLGDDVYEEERRRGASIPVSDIVAEVESLV